MCDTAADAFPGYDGKFDYCDGTPTDCSEKATV